MCYDVSMSSLGIEIGNLKQKYREIFLKTHDELTSQLFQSKPTVDCAFCENKCEKVDDCDLLFEKFPTDCKYTKWQKDVLNLLENNLSKDIFDKWVKILAYRRTFSCAGCATCCKLACSEFSPQELKEKAEKGDKFATQFLSVFIPYESKEEAQKIYPEYFDMLDEKLQGENIYFYHCPKLTDDNRCSDYENRPDICRDFPDNPLSLLPPACGFSTWKDEVEVNALMLHSLLEIIDFYKGKIPK